MLWHVCKKKKTHVFVQRLIRTSCDLHKLKKKTCLAQHVAPRDTLDLALRRKERQVLKWFANCVNTNKGSMRRRWFHAQCAKKLFALLPNVKVTPVPRFAKAVTSQCVKSVRRCVKAKNTMVIPIKSFIAKSVWPRTNLVFVNLAFK